MINNSRQLQNAMELNGNLQYNTIRNNKSARRTLFIGLLFIFFYVGKWNLFLAFRVSTDYLFWALLFGCIIFFTLIERKLLISKSCIPFIIYLLYQFFEMKHSAYPSTALPIFIFNILTICVFFFVKDRKGYDISFNTCLYYGGLYYTISVLLQAVFPSVINGIRSILLTSTDVATALRGYENTTRYLSGLASNSAVAAFFISMMVGIAVSRMIMNNSVKINALITVMGILALFLTQKRSFALGTILAFVITVLFFKRDVAKKFKFLMIVFVVGSIGLYVMYTTMPAMTIFLNRLFQNQDILSGRNNMYNVMETWFNSNKLFGVGIGTANYTFGYGGHNCYRQLLAEEGIVGCIIYAVMVCPYIYKLFKRLNVSWNSSVDDGHTEILLGSTICLIIILIYALVGNPFYDFTFCLTMFMLLAVPTQAVD